MNDETIAEKLDSLHELVYDLHVILLSYIGDQTLILQGLETPEWTEPTE